MGMGTSYYNYPLTTLTYAALFLIAQSAGGVVGHNLMKTGSDALPSLSEVSTSQEIGVGIQAVAESSTNSRPLSETYVSILQSSSFPKEADPSPTKIQIEMVTQPDLQLSSSNVPEILQNKKPPQPTSSESSQIIQAAQVPSHSPSPSPSPSTESSHGLSVAIQTEEGPAVASTGQPPSSPPQPPSPLSLKGTLLDPAIQIAQETPQERPSSPVEQMPPAPIASSESILPDSPSVGQATSTPVPANLASTATIESPTPPAQTENSGSIGSSNAPPNLQSSIESTPPSPPNSESKTDIPQPPTSDSLSLTQFPFSSSEISFVSTTSPTTSMLATTVNTDVSSASSLPLGSSMQTWPPVSTEPTSLPSSTPIKLSKIKKSMTGAWIGIAIGIVAFIILLIVAGLYYRKRRNSPKQPTSPGVLTTYKAELGDSFPEPKLPLIAINGEIDRELSDTATIGGSGSLAGVTAVGMHREEENAREPRPRDTLLDAWKKGVVPEAPPSQEHLIPPASALEEVQIDDMPGFIGSSDLGSLDKGLSGERQHETAPSDEHTYRASSVGLAL